MKKLLPILLGSLLVFSLIGCNSSLPQEPATNETQKENEANETQKEDAPTETTEKETKSDEEVTLRILSAVDTVDQTMMQEFMDATEGINIEYEYVTAADYPAKFAALATAGELPDVFWTQSGYYCDQIKEGLLMDLSEQLQSQSHEGDKAWKDTFVPELLLNLENIAVKGVGGMDSYNYGVPFGMTTVAVIYDKALYDELGLAVPTTWEQFMSNCETLKNADYTAVSVQNNTCVDWFPRLFWDQYCRDELEEQGLTFEDGAMTFQTESVQEGLIQFKNIWDKGYLPASFMTDTLDTVNQLFIQGELVQLMITPDKIQYLVENSPESMQLATYALPGINGLPSRSLGGASIIFAANANTEHPEEAVKLLKYITSKTNFETNKALVYSNSGLLDVERGDAYDLLLDGYTEAAAGGFTSDISVPTTVSTHINNTFKSDIIPNYLMGIYDLETTSTMLQDLYDEYLSELSN